MFIHSVHIDEDDLNGETGWETKGNFHNFIDVLFLGLSSKKPKL